MSILIIFMVIFSGMIVILAIQLAMIDIEFGVAIEPMIPPIPAGVGKFCPILKNCVVAVMAREIVMIVGMIVRVLFFIFRSSLCLKYMIPQHVRKILMV